MRPPRSRTWGRRGITPVIRVRGGNIVLIWDNLNIHLKAGLRAFTDAQA